MKGRIAICPDSGQAGMTKKKGCTAFGTALHSKFYLINSNQHPRTSSFSSIQH
jgi:hypothetical protein